MRELENVIERAVALCARRSRSASRCCRPTVVRARTRAGRDRLPAEGVSLETCSPSYERGLLLEALEQCGGVKKRAAQRLGISFRSFRYRLEKLGLDGGADDPTRRSDDSPPRLAPSASAAHARSGERSAYSEVAAAIRG